MSRSRGCLPKGGVSSERDMKTAGEEAAVDDLELAQPICTLKPSDCEAVVRNSQR